MPGMALKLLKNIPPAALPKDRHFDSLSPVQRLVATLTAYLLHSPLGDVQYLTNMENDFLETCLTCGKTCLGVKDAPLCIRIVHGKHARIRSQRIILPPYAYLTRRTEMHKRPLIGLNHDGES